MRSPSLLVAALLATLLAAGGTSTAQTPPHAHDADLARAHDLVRRGEAEAALAILDSRLAEASTDAGALYVAGLARASQGRYPEALALFERSLAADPGSRARRELGLLLGSAGRLRDCLALLGPWFDSHPEDIEAGFAAAFCALELQRADDTRRLLARLPAEALPRRILSGRLLLFESKPQQAVDELAPALPAASGTMELDVRRLMAEAHLALGQASRAVELLRGHDRTASTARQLAEAYFQSGDTAAAARTLAPWANELVGTAGTPAGGETVPILREHGRYLLQLGRGEEAIEFLDTATSLQPDDKQAWDLLARALASAGRLEEAERAVERFGRLVEQDDPESIKDRRAETRLEDPTAAALEEAVELAARGRTSEALELLAEEGRLAPDDVRPRVVAARILLAEGRAEEALAAADRGVAIEPASPLPHRERGRALAALGRVGEAASALREALELRPDYLDALLDLARLEAAAGRPETALELLERARELAPDDARVEALGGELGGELDGELDGEIDGADG